MCKKNIILPVVLYGYKSLYSILRKEYGLRIFENRVMRILDVEGGWRRLHKEELHNLYTSPNDQIKED
jgi:hypothetical protein